MKRKLKLHATKESFARWLEKEVQRGKSFRLLLPGKKHGLFYGTKNPSDFRIRPALETGIVGEVPLIQGSLSEVDRDQVLSISIRRPLITPMLPVFVALAWGCFLWYSLGQSVSKVLPFLYFFLLLAVLTSIGFYAVGGWQVRKAAQLFLESLRAGGIAYEELAPEKYE